MGIDAVLLIGVTDRVAGERCAVEVAYLTMAKVARLFLRPAVPAQRHPAGVDDGPAFFRLVADDRGQDGQGDLVLTADADVVHDQVEEHIDAGAHLGNAGEVDAPPARWASSRC